MDLIEVEPYLRAIGFQTKSVLVVAHLNVTNDVAILKYARRYGYILVCHDKHEPERKKRGSTDHSSSGKPTPEAWFSELANKGGMVIEIEGGQQQPALEAVGKLMIHRSAWLEFFAETHGAVLVHANGMQRKNPERLLKELGKNLTLQQQFPSKPAQSQVQAPRSKRPRRFPGDTLTPSLIPGSGAA